MATLVFYGGPGNFTDAVSRNYIGMVKNALPRADFDRMQIDYNQLRMQYRVFFMKGEKELGVIEIEGAADLLSEVNLAKIMLMCG